MSGSNCVVVRTLIYQILARMLETLTVRMKFTFWKYNFYESLFS